MITSFPDAKEYKLLAWNYPLLSPALLHEIGGPHKRLREALIEPFTVFCAWHHAIISATLDISDHLFMAYSYSKNPLIYAHRATSISLTTLMFFLLHAERLLDRIRPKLSSILSSGSTSISS